MKLPDISILVTFNTWVRWRLWQSLEFSLAFWICSRRRTSWTSWKSNRTFVSYLWTGSVFTQSITFCSFNDSYVVQRQKQHSLFSCIVCLQKLYKMCSKLVWAKKNKNKKVVSNEAFHKFFLHILCTWEMCNTEQIKIFLETPSQIERAGERWGFLQ